MQRDETAGWTTGRTCRWSRCSPRPTCRCCRCRCPPWTRRQLFALGRRLAPLRDQGTLIVGSGFTTHNLRWFNPQAGADAPPPAASVEFDHWAAETLGRNDVDAVLDFAAKAPAAHEAHPRTEHWAPLYVSLGAAYESGSLDSQSVIDGLLVRDVQAVLAVLLSPVGNQPD